MTTNQIDYCIELAHTLMLSAKLDDVPFVSLFGVESHWKGGPSAHCLM